MRNRTSFQIVFLFFLIIGQTGMLSASTSGNRSGNSDDKETDSKKIQFHLRPSLGLTFSDSNAEGERSTNLQWLGTVNSDFDYIGKFFDLSSTLFVQYGETKANGEKAEVMQDAFILSLTPSIPLLKVPVIRLFLETTAETSLGKGMIGDKETGFLDPLFLYQTLFVGQKHYSYQKDDKTSWELTYGLGYAFQETLNKNFQLEENLPGNSNFESGYSGILEFNVNSQISESLNFVLNAKAVALSREDFFSNFDQSRRSVLVRSGLFYKKVGIEYNYHQVHDLNLSEDKIVDQSIMLTLSF